MSDDVPIVVVLKAMGVASDQEVVQLVGSEGKFSQAMAASLQECTSLGINTPADALEFIGKKVRAASRGEWQRAARRSKVDEARELLAHVLLAHVSVVDYNFWPQVVYFAQMLRRMIYAEGDASFMVSVRVWVKVRVRV